MARFVNAQVPEVVQPFGDRAPARPPDSPPRRPTRTPSSAPDGTRGESMRGIARRLGRAPSTITRELCRNARRGGYRATMSHAMAFERASRPKPAKLHSKLALRAIVQDDMTRRFSPEQIAGRLRRRFPEDPGDVGVDRDDLPVALRAVARRAAARADPLPAHRAGAAQAGRQPGQRKNRIPDMVNISHWEGDLLIGKRNATAIGTLVERASGFAMLVPLPDGYKPDNVAPALARKVQTPPDALRRSLTWDQGPEMRDWKQVHVDAGIDVFFCDPHAPWQRGSNENTNGLLRQYFPKGTDLGAISEAQLDAVAELNDRPPQAPPCRQPDRAAHRAALR